jgi:uracil-DNA glycosylase
MSLSIEEYSKYDDWKDYFKKNDTLKLNYNISWHIMFSLIKQNDKFQKSCEKLKEIVEDEKYIYPKPKLLLKAFDITPANRLKVVILGQDPYINHYENNSGDGYSPEAMGMSFSVPDDCKIPPSLINIYKNQKKFKHISKYPDNGNLWFWSIQGVLLLNASLTVTRKKPKSHTKIWEWMTNEIIEYISENFDDIVFMLWGADAFKKLSLIDLEKHKVSISSHPSPLACNKKFRKYDPFMDVDHFGICNKFLKENNKREIMWKIPDLIK